MISKRNERRLRKKQRLESWKGRQCGECTACCTVLGVTELEKPAFTPCQHCDAGCKIYPQRPKTCQTYSCSWKVGALPEEYHPLKCGVIIDTTNPLGAHTVREVYPGSSGTWRARQVIDFLSSQVVTIVVRGEQDRSILGPPAAVRQFMQQVHKRVSQD